MAHIGAIIHLCWLAFFLASGAGIADADVFFLWTGDDDMALHDDAALLVQYGHIGCAGDLRDEDERLCAVCENAKMFGVSNDYGPCFFAEAD